MKNSKHIKVSVSERLPEKFGITGVIDNKGVLKTTEFSRITNEEIFRLNYDFFLEEVPDYEDEMKEMLEKIISIAALGEKVPDYMVHEAENLLTKLKTES